MERWEAYLVELLAGCKQLGIDVELFFAHICCYLEVVE